MVAAARVIAFVIAAAAATIQALLLETFREDVVRAGYGPVATASAQDAVAVSLGLAVAIIAAALFLLLSSRSRALLA